MTSPSFIASLFYLAAGLESIIRRVSIERPESESLKPQVLHGGGAGGKGCGLSTTAEPRGLNKLPAASEAVELNTTTPIVATVAPRRLRSSSSSFQDCVLSPRRRSDR